jgi:hypothetical protein
MLAVIVRVRVRVAVGTMRLGMGARRLSMQWSGVRRRPSWHETLILWRLFRSCSFVHAVCKQYRREESGRCMDGIWHVLVIQEEVEGVHDLVI